MIKLKFTFVVIVLSISLLNCKKHNENNRLINDVGSQDPLSIVEDLVEDTTYISLLVQFYDAIKKERRNEVLIIGKYYNGKYYSFEESIEDSGKINQTITANIFNRIKTFSAFIKGVKLAEYYIEELSLSEFSCLALPTGKAKMLRKYNDVSPTSKQSYTGYSEGNDVDYSFNYYLAINSSAKALNHKQVQPLDSNLTEEEQISIEKCIRKEFEKDKYKIVSLTRNDYRIASYKLGVDEGKYYIITYHHDTDSLCYSSCHIVTFSDNKINEKLTISNINEIDAWGNGYKLFDVFDIDGDGLNEIIFEIGYYESTGFEIYKFVNDKFQKVMEVIPWGC